VKPLAIDLYCGLGGWTEGFLAEGYEVIGFDIERRPYPGQLVIQDVLTLHGSQFKGAAIIVGSSPCQEFSYRAMPWKRAKALPPPYLGMQLFNAQFRIQREANYATGFLCDTCQHSGACPSCWDMPRRYIPLVVENVKGAQPWVGKAKAHFGSYYVWGDVESVGGAIVCGGVRFGNTLRAARRVQKFNPDGTEHGQGSWFKIADSKNRGSSKNDGGSWFNIAHNTESGTGNNPDGRKGYVGGLGRGHGRDPAARHNSKSPKRKQASAEIARIPFDLARYIASVFKPLLAAGEHRADAEDHRAIGKSGDQLSISQQQKGQA